MKNGSKILKRKLIVQSFLPLFILTFIKHFDYEIIIDSKKFIQRLSDGQLSVLNKVIPHPHTWMFLMLLLSLVGTISGFIAIWQFSYFHFSGYEDAGEYVNIKNEKNESGISFFMTFILPLMMDEVKSINDFIVYVGVLYLTMTLMAKTNLYYQNPILTLLGYKICVFEIENPDNEENGNKDWIGICRKDIKEDKIVIWKDIADNVCIIRNKNGEGSNE